MLGRWFDCLPLIVYRGLAAIESPLGAKNLAVSPPRGRLLETECLQANNVQNHQALTWVHLMRLGWAWARRRLLIIVVGLLHRLRDLSKLNEYTMHVAFAEILLHAIWRK